MKRGDHRVDSECSFSNYIEHGKAQAFPHKREETNGSGIIDKVAGKIVNLLAKNYALQLNAGRHRCCQSPVSKGCRPILETLPLNL
jgi:hypothetical protein